MKTSVSESCHPIILIIAPEVLVARDIEMIIRDNVPNAEVVFARTLGNAVYILPHGSIAMAFAQLSPAAIANSPLGERLEADGSRMVILSDDSNADLPTGWISLPIPFSTEDVAALLKAGP